MKTLKKLLLIVIFILFVSIVAGCESKSTKVYIGDDGNWYIDDVNTGVYSMGQDGVNGKSAYEIAVENGYTGSLEQWIEGLKNSDGTVTVHNKDHDEVVELFKLLMVNYYYLLVKLKLLLLNLEL